jgi:hypothetical protein
MRAQGLGSLVEQGGAPKERSSTVPWKGPSLASVHKQREKPYFGTWASTSLGDSDTLGSFPFRRMLISHLKRLMSFLDFRFFGAPHASHASSHTSSNLRTFLLLPSHLLANLQIIFRTSRYPADRDSITNILVTRNEGATIVVLGLAITCLSPFVRVHGVRFWVSRLRVCHV